MKKLLAILVLIFSVSVQASETLVLDFEGLPGQYELTGLSPTIQLASYKITYVPAVGEQFPTSLHSVGPAWRFNTRSIALTANSCNAVLTLQRADQRPFRLARIDLAPLNGDPNTVVTVQGHSDKGAIVLQTVVLPSVGWLTVALSEAFTHLSKVTIVQGNCDLNPPHMIDNVVVESD
jgi:hypothetical protein